jgi:hypothetical protein
MPNTLSTLRTRDPRKVLLHGLLPLAVVVMNGCTDGLAPMLSVWVGSYTLDTVGGAALPAQVDEWPTSRFVIDSARIDKWKGPVGEIEFFMTRIFDEGGESPVLERWYWNKLAKFSESDGHLLITYGANLGMQMLTDTVVASAGTLRIKGLQGFGFGSDYVISRSR